MFLPYRLMALELRRTSCWKTYLQYQKALGKCNKNSLRLQFLKKCKQSNIIPRFLKFRIPTNGCFDDKAVHEFQVKLLKKEIITSRSDLAANIERLAQKRNAIKVEFLYLFRFWTKEGKRKPNTAQIWGKITFLASPIMVILY